MVSCAKYGTIWDEAKFWHGIGMPSLDGHAKNLELAWEREVGWNWSKHIPIWLSIVIVVAIKQSEQNLGFPFVLRGLV